MAPALSTKFDYAGIYKFLIFYPLIHSEIRNPLENVKQITSVSFRIATKRTFHVLSIHSLDQTNRSCYRSLYQCYDSTYLINVRIETARLYVCVCACVGSYLQSYLLLT